MRSRSPPPVASAIAGLATFAALATPALGAEPTTLTIDPPAPAAPRYSQAIELTMRLARAADDSPVQGTECAPPCSIIVTIEPADGSASYIVNAQGFVTDTTGAAQARIAFVDGRYLEARTAEPVAFDADDEGAPWVIRARFLGAGPGTVPDNPDCAPGAAGTPGGLCPSEATFEVPLFLETANIALGAGLEGELGETLTLSAELQDPNGEAAPGGDDIDGPGPQDLVGRTVSFYYDLDNNGRPAASELVGSAPTNAAGVASITFTLDPDFVRAGTYNQGIHAEFGGDGRYGVARASTPLVVRPADVDVSRTVLEISPAEIPADGFSKATLRVRLVDSFNNPLDETSAPHEVVFATDLGLLLESPQRDPLNGTYAQTLQAQRRPGTATVTVFVDGEEGPSKTLEITGEGGCRCGASGDAPLTGAFAAALAALMLRRRRRSPARRAWRSTGAGR
jgi:uncharacterized protein (TIGR03382 family)